jgi:MinD-like ATPase involved in chromosome partitioning or flagellar assembly
MALKVQMYSFKGGAGRTVSTANIARIISAERGQRVLAIDLDIESAGLSVLFGIDELVEERKLGAIQDILRGSFEAPAEDDRITSERDGDDSHESPPSEENIEVFSMGAAAFFKSVWPRVNVQPSAYPNLTIIPARRIVTSSREPSTLYNMNKRFEQLLINVQRIANAPEIIFFDSASGIQNTAVLGLENCDVLVMFVRWSRQFVQGTKQFLRELAKHSTGLHKLTRVLVVPTAVPTSSAATGAVRQFRAELEQSITAANLSAENHLRKSRDWIMLLPDGIPDAEELRWDDRVLNGAELDDTSPTPLHAVMTAYRHLAQVLVDERIGARRVVTTQ